MFLSFTLIGTMIGLYIYPRTPSVFLSISSEILMHIQHFFDQETGTLTYIVSDAATQHCAIIDSVLNYDMSAGKTYTRSADELISYVRNNDLIVEWILETHAHADHLSAAAYLKESLGGKIAIGEHIRQVLDYWVPIFDTAKDTPLDGSQFDHLLIEGEVFYIGKLPVKVLVTPGHTPDCVSYYIQDAVFVGDTLFMPSVGTARTDFPGGSAEQSYDSIQKILSLPGETRIFTCHDYPPEGTPPAFMSTVNEQKKQNQMIRDGISRSAYVLARNKKDENNSVPRLLLPSIQVNLRAGQFGVLSDNGVQYIKIPLNKM
jgi:glyoxylase-like metal-dependent hydrolase (beta-lactamase superfamily II)